MRLDEFTPLTEAEQAVIAGLGTGHVTMLGDGSLPDETAGEDRQVRASLIRWLALGAPGDESVQLHEKGLRIEGALVVSDGKGGQALDLEGCTLAQNLALIACRFMRAPLLLGARVQSLFLNRAALPGLTADRLEARGSVSLCDVHATGAIRLLGAQIGSNLDCTGGRFENAGGKALNADGLEAQGNVFLSDVHAIGEVRLVGAQVSGSLSCTGGMFETERVNALNFQGAHVTGTLFWREGSRATGAIDLTAAETGDICDEPACWPGQGNLLLDRCRYGAFVGKGVSGAERIRWLDLQTPERFGDDFWPQPWEQCAKVLREMGHAEDARQVLIEKEKRQRSGPRKRAAAHLSKIRGRIAEVERKAPAHDIDARLAARSGLIEAWCQLAALRLRDGALGALIAYGYRPLRALWWLVALWIFGWGVFAAAHDDGGFKPNNAFILAKPEWAQCEAGGELRGDHPSTLACYRAQPEAAGYPRFNALLYSLDTLVPVVDLEVQDYWVPDERVAPLTRWYLWGHIGMGWFLALLAVAGFSGLVQTKATEE